MPDDFHVGMLHVDRVAPVPESDLPAKPLADLGCDLIAIVDAEAGNQRVFHRGLGLGAHPDAPHQPQPADGQDGHGENAEPGFQRTAQYHEPGEEQLQRQPDPGQLGGQQGGAEQGPGHGPTGDRPGREDSDHGDHVEQGQCGQ